MPSVWAAILAFRVKHESGTAFIASLPIPAGRRFFFPKKARPFPEKEVAACCSARASLARLQAEMYFSEAHVPGKNN